MAAEILYVQGLFSALTFVPMVRHLCSGYSNVVLTDPCMEENTRPVRHMAQVDLVLCHLNPKLCFLSRRMSSSPSSCTNTSDNLAACGRCSPEPKSQLF